MSPTAFKAACDTLRWTPTDVARWCGYSRPSSTYWTNGKVSVPKPVALWLYARLIGDFTEPPTRTGRHPRHEPKLRTKHPRVFA